MRRPFRVRPSSHTRSPNQAMHARLLVSTVVLVLGTPVLAASDAPPTTPTNLTARAYDATSGAIHWGRSTDDRGAVRGYEISRDGAVIFVRDTLSYVDRALVGGTTYTFGVTAINNAGQRSGTAVTRLTTPGVMPTTSAISGLVAPGALRADVYSTRDAELFWTRPAMPGLLHEIRRNGQVIATTDGSSHHVASLSSGQAYVFEVVAIDRLGRRSAASTVTLRTAGGRTTIVGTSGGDALDPSPSTPPTTPVSEFSAAGRPSASVPLPTASDIA